MAWLTPLDEDIRNNIRQRIRNTQNDTAQINIVAVTSQSKIDTHSTVKSQLHSNTTQGSTDAQHHR